MAFDYDYTSGTLIARAPVTDAVTAGITGDGAGAAALAGAPGSAVSFETASA